MDKMTQNWVEGFMAELIAKNPGEKEFHQAVREVVESVAPYIMQNPHLLDQKIMERIVEPERMIMFRVPWMDDKGEIHVNRGFRVQMNSAIGPYKCGMQGMFNFCTFRLVHLASKLALERHRNASSI